MAEEGPLHRDRAGRFPGRAAAGEPGLPVQRPPEQLTGLADPVPGQHPARHRRPDHPVQGAGVAGLRRGQGVRHRREVTRPRRGPLRLAQHPARHRSPDRRDRRLRRVDHLHDQLPEQHPPDHQDPDPDLPVHRCRAGYRRHPGLGLPDRPDRPPDRVRRRHRLRRRLGPTDVRPGQHRAADRHRDHTGHLLHRLPERARRRPGLLVPRAVHRRPPRLRRLPGLPDLGHGVRVHPVHHHPALPQVRLGRPGAAVQQLRPDRPDRRPHHPGDVRPAERALAAAATAQPIHVSVDHPLPDSEPLTSKELA